MAKEKVQIRKAPKFLPFLILFAVIGVIVALVLNASVSDADRTAQPVLGVLMAYLAGIGGAFGLILALVLDFISSKRSKTVEAERSR
jgi:uncharacterized membrane protein